jgi:hypothetical protein
MVTDGACGLLFCAAKRSGAFPPNMPAGTPDQKGQKINGTTRENKIGEPRSGLFGPRIGFSLAKILQMQSNEHDATSPTPTIIFFLAFWYFPSPKRGRGGVGGRAAARSRGNEMNTAGRSNALLTCRLAIF